MLSNRRYAATSRLKASKKLSPPAKKRVAPKQEWNSYLTDADRYKMSKEEILRKKGLLLSRHNALHEEAGSIAPRTTVVRAQMRPENTVNSNSGDHDRNDDDEVNALDLLGSADNLTLPTTPALERKRKHVSSSAKKPQKKADDRRVSSSPSHKMGATAKRLAFGRHDTVGADQSRKPHSPSITAAEHGHTDTHGCGESVNSGSIRGRSNSGASPLKARHPSPPRRSPAPKHLSGVGLNGTSTVTATAGQGQDKDEDLVYVADEVRSLFSELKFYEELSGRRSILDTREELEQMLKDDALLRPQDHRPVMRYLVNLVCQSLTYLLKSEVDLQDQTKHYEQLRAKYETLNALLEPEERAIPRVSDLDSLEPGAMVTSHSKVGTPAPGGIAFREDDLYPSVQWRDPEYARLVSQASSTTPIAALAIAAAATASGLATLASAQADSRGTGETQGHDEDHQPSSALRRLAQQYAQDEQYPVPGDADAEVHALSYGRAESGADPATALFASPSPAHLPLAAKASATPARFTERLQQPHAGRNRTSSGPAIAPSTTLAPATPVRNPASTARQNPYNSVSSTCSTPPVGQLVKQYVQPSIHATARGKTAESIMSQMYPHLSTPATYAPDAFAAYLPGTRRPTTCAGAESPARMMDVAYTPASGKSRAHATGAVRDDAAAGAMEVNTSAFAADLSQLDAILERSRRIASQSAPVLSSLTAKTGGVLTSGEYSTINRLTENFVPVGGRTPADESLLSAAPTGTNVSTLLDTSSFSVTRAQEHFGRQQLAASQDSLLPPPPPPVSAQAGPLGSAMPGTSPSDWLFSAYAQVATPAARETADQAAGLLLTPTRPGMKQVAVKPHTPVPQSFAHTAAKHRLSHTTPATADLYQPHQHQQGQMGAERMDSPDSVGDATIDRLTQQFSAVAVGPSGSGNREASLLPTPPPRAVASSGDALSQLKRWAMEGQQDSVTTPELHGATSLQTAQVRKVRLSDPPVAEQQARKQSVVSVKRTTATPPGSAQKPVTKVVIPSSLQEGASVIHPNSVLPSPAAAPVHPFAHKQMQHVRSSEVSGHHSSSSVSNANTPTSFAPLPLPGRVFDARYGSF